MARKNDQNQNTKPQKTKSGNKHGSKSWTMPKPPPEARPLPKPKPQTDKPKKQSSFNLTLYTSNHKFVTWGFLFQSPLSQFLIMQRYLKLLIVQFILQFFFIPNSKNHIIQRCMPASDTTSSGADEESSDSVSDDTAPPSSQASELAISPFPLCPFHESCEENPVLRKS